MAKMSISEINATASTVTDTSRWKISSQNVHANATKTEQ